MGLVDYSDSESETEAQPKDLAAKQPTSKTNNKPFQKFVDRSNPGKILVNLPTTSGSGTTGPQQSSDEPPAKRARTAGGNRFSGFGSFLPPPKTTGKPPALSQSSSGNSKSATRPGILLKTGAEPAFNRELPSADNGAWDEDGADGDDDGLERGGSRLKLPPPKSHSTSSAGPSIPEEQKPAEEVKLVGKPLMFKPLSVSRKPAKKKEKTGGATGGGVTSKTTTEAPKPVGQTPKPKEPAKKKVSLFSFGEDSAAPAEPSGSTSAYEPLFAAETGADASAPAEYYDPYPTSASYPLPTTNPAPASDLSSIANDLNLSKAARRELFGRDGAGAAANSRIVNFDMEREYSHNESLRAAGETVTHNPIRSIAPGKHSLRQLVNAVQNNASALEESFASGKNKRGEAAGRYGWR